MFFEKSDESKINDLHNELITANAKLTKELEELREVQRSQDSELRETSNKLHAANEKLKTLERTKQCDDMVNLIHF